MMMDVNAYTVIHTIELSYSCRSYKNKVLSGEVKSQLLDYKDDIQAVKNGTDP